MTSEDLKITQQAGLLMSTKGWGRETEIETPDRAGETRADYSYSPHQVTPYLFSFQA